jgi:hypothetical protein
MSKTITLSDEQYQLLSDIVDQMIKQDNRATQYPLFYVYEKQELWVDGDDSATRLMFVNCEGDEVDEIDFNDKELWKKVDGEWETDWHCDETDETIDQLEACDKFDLRLIHVREEDVPVVNVGPFFTEEAAEAHIKFNSYHYRKPFTYVNSAWRNYELQELMKIMFTMMGKEIPSCYK